MTTRHDCEWGRVGGGKLKNIHSTIQLLKNQQTVYFQLTPKRVSRKFLQGASKGYLRVPGCVCVRGSYAYFW